MGQGCPAGQHIRPVAIEPHMAPEGSMGVPLVRLHPPHVGKGGAGKVEGPPVGAHEGLHHIGVVELLRPHGIDGGQHLRHGAGALEFGHHRINHRWIDEGLVALHIHDHRFRESRSRLPPGEGEERVQGGSQTLAAGAALGRGEQGRKTPVLRGLHQGRAVRTKHHSLGPLGQGTALQHSLQHRPASDVGHHLAGQPGRVEASRHCHHESHRSTLHWPEPIPNPP